MISQVGNLLSAPVFTGTQMMIQVNAATGQLIALDYSLELSQILLIFVQCNENAV